MTTEHTPRREPCTTCDQPVVRVALHSDGLRAGSLVSRPPTVYYRHAAGGYVGERIDGDCNLPDYYKS